MPSATELQDTAALVAENARLRAELEQAERRSEAFQRVTQVFASLADLDETRANLAATIAGLLGAERCAVITLEPGSRTLVARAPGYGWTTAEIAAFRIALDEPSATTRAWLLAQPYFSNDPRHDERNLHRYVDLYGERNLLAVPLVVGSRTAAVVRVSNRPGGFSEADVELVQTIGAPAALALDNARLYQAMAHERERLSAIFQNASDGIMITDQDRRVVAMNPAMERLSGYPAREAIGSACERVQSCHEESGASICRTTCPISRLVVERRAIPYFETRITTRDGEERDVAVSYSLIPVPGRPGEHYGLAITRDISPAKAVERLKTQFLSTVSHELRTPLAAIRASVGVLADHLPEEFPAPLRKLVGNIDRSSSRLETLIADLLDLARLQSGRGEFRRAPTDLRRVAEGAIAIVRPLTDQKDQSIALIAPDRPLTAHVDGPRIEQVLVNLLSNAHKYSPPERPIEVRLTDDADGVRIAVIDQGPGIAGIDRGAIFERFERLPDDVTQRNPGSGLGLPIAKAIVEQHGGRIGVDSRVGAGSTFWVTLPKEGGLSHENSAH